MKIEQLENTLLGAAAVLLVAAAALAWLAVAQHPSARNVKRALLLSVNGI